MMISASPNRLSSSIFRIAKLLLTALHLRHLSTAATQAAMRADAMLEAGDLDGYAVWKRILRAVEELQEVEPGTRVH